MYEDIAALLLYGDLDKEGILYAFGEIFAAYHSKTFDRARLVGQIHTQVRHLLMLATDYGFDGNLWHNYLAFTLCMNENPFSLTCEKTGAGEGTANQLAKEDFAAYKRLFDYDFRPIERDLGIDCFSVLTHYRALTKPKFRVNQNVSEKVRMLSQSLEEAEDTEEFFCAVTDFYRRFGVGMFGMNKAFRIREEPSGDITFCPISNMDPVVLDDLIGYEIQKKKLVENTESFVLGRPANNVLLYGDSGTGKSTSIKAIVNEYYEAGLRMIEIYKHQFHSLSDVIAAVKNRNYKFILYMDDLSFEEFETEYKFLKAVIEGGVETRPQNVLIYATSNRRHLIRENWNDRNDADGDKHHSDTVEEKLSLVNRFGVTIGYDKPSQKEYFAIVLELAARVGIGLSKEELCEEANRWELAHGGLSGRTAQQFINHLLGQELDGA